MSAARNVYVNDQMMPNNRRPIVITDDRIATGARAAHVRNDDPEALLRQYLRLIRRVRNQRRGRNIALRRADIVTLADHLGWTEDQVLARLADLMGATSRQRATMLAILATGASLITISAPATATATATDDTLADELPIVVVHDDALLSPAAVSRAARHAPVVAPSMPAGPRPTNAPPDGAPGVGGDPIAAAPDLTDGTDLDETPRVTEAVAVPELVDEPPIVDAPSSAPAVDDDGDTVAVGLPPVPPATDDDTVAVGQPPVPPGPSSTPAVDDDGDTVAVGLPPVPPPAP